MIAIKLDFAFVGDFRQNSMRIQLNAKKLPDTGAVLAHKPIGSEIAVLIGTKSSIKHPATIKIDLIRDAHF